MPAEAPTQDDLYQKAAENYGAALERLARAYEANPEVRRDLLQDIHIGLWRSFASFNERCSLRTWVYRVAHNVATSHVIRQRRTKSATLVGLEELESVPDEGANVCEADRRHILERLLELIQRLKPLDRQVILSYLEGLDAASIGDITGISPGNVATKIHRIKRILARRFQEGGQDDK
jgi:RNA polymerase sigma-70 factor (ECF subfamily)